MQPPAEPNDAPKRIESAPRRVVLIGASVRAAAQSAQRAGFRVTGVDLFGDIDTREACEHFFRLDDDSQRSSLQASCAGVPSLVVSGLNEWRNAADRIQAHCPPLGATLPPQFWQDDRWLARLAEAAGMRYPETRSPEKSAAESGRWLRKKRNSSGGLGVEWFSADGSGEACEPSAPDRIQRWVGGRVIGATFLIHDHDAKLLGICRSLFTRLRSRPFVYRGSVGPVPVSPSLMKKISDLGALVAAETGIRGLINADLVIDRRGDPWLLEFNPRWSGSCEALEKALIGKGERSLFGCHVDAIEGQPLEPSLCSPRPNAPSLIKRVLFARRLVKFQLARAELALGGQSRVQDIPEDGTLIQKGEPICTLLTEFPRGEALFEHRQKKSPMWEHRAHACRLMKALALPD
ncbi:MAG: ATP-grasp domain-containing protein [Rubripirellula sp.]